MYIFEAHYTDMDNNEEIIRKIEFEDCVRWQEKEGCNISRMIMRQHITMISRNLE